MLVVFSFRPFSVQKVRSTNLILVAVNNLCPCDSRKLDIEPVEVKYDEEQKCRRLLMQHYRKRPPTCVNYHPDVSLFFYGYSCKFSSGIVQGVGILIFSSTVLGGKRCYKFFKTYYCIINCSSLFFSFIMKTLIFFFFSILSHGHATHKIIFFNKQTLETTPMITCHSS